MKKIVTLLGFGVLALTGCTFSANFTISPDALATAAAERLVEVTGSPVTPDIDCGDESIALVADTSLTCALTVEGVEGVYDADIVITEVSGTDFHFNVQVAEEPRA